MTTAADLKEWIDEQRPRSIRAELRRIADEPDEVVKPEVEVEPVAKAEPKVVVPWEQTAAKTLAETKNEIRNSRERQRIIAQSIIDRATEALQRKEPGTYGGATGRARAMAYLLDHDADCRTAYEHLRNAAPRQDDRASTRRSD